MEERIKGLNLVLLGKMGAGKSASGNTILGREAFESKESFTSVTNCLGVESGAVFGFQVTVYDTPGLFNKKISEEDIKRMYKKVLVKCESGPSVFLLVIKADRFTADDRETVEKIEKILGEKRQEKTWILFTRGDELEEENMTIQEFINDTERLKTLVQKYEQRYHVFNNRTRGDTEQVKTLFTKILKLRKPPKNDRDTPVSRLSSRRIVLLGQSGVGKSASGNTILGRREFRSDIGSNSVTSVCSEAQDTVSGRSVFVVDTPGFNHTHMSNEELKKEIGRSVYLSRPGAHAFLIVFNFDGRFTEQDQMITEQIELMFGEEVLKYSIVLFTHGYDQSVEEIIDENSRLSDLVQKCGGRFHIFNNRDVNNRDQVNELLQKIDSMIEENRGGHYSCEMMEEAHRIRRVKKLIEDGIERVRKDRKRRHLLINFGAFIGAVACFIALPVAFGGVYGLNSLDNGNKGHAVLVVIITVGCVVALAAGAAVGAVCGVITARVQNTRRRRRENNRSARS